MNDWKEVLAPGPECIGVARLDDLDAAAYIHIDSCARCQSELALFREIVREESSPEEVRAVEWIAGELQRRNNVVSFRPKAGRVLYAAAAALLMAIGAGTWMQMREPSIDAPVGGPAVYRSARLDVIAPVGDLAQPPNELRWNVVPQASQYRVRLMEVDGTVVWNSETVKPAVALPPTVVAQFAPGKSLLWEVKAFRGNEMLASSGTQTVRVSVKPLRRNR